MGVYKVSLLLWLFIIDTSTEAWFPPCWCEVNHSYDKMRKQHEKAANWQVCTKLASLYSQHTRSNMVGGSISWCISWSRNRVPIHFFEFPYRSSPSSYILEKVLLNWVRIYKSLCLMQRCLLFVFTFNNKNLNKLFFDLLMRIPNHQTKA